MNADAFVQGLFDGGGTYMVGEDGHTNEPGPHSTESRLGGTAAGVPGCPACEGRWENGAWA